MKPIHLLLTSSLLLAVSAQAREFVLSDASANTRLDTWSITSAELGIDSAAPFTVRKRVLHGGRQDGVELIEVENGRLNFSVIPTRGMSIYRVTSGGVTLGWNSPVKELVHPSYIELESRGGLGWLDGFNEFMVRCGVEWAGHPGMDNGKLLSLHGRAGNIPASKVVVVIDDQPPHRIRVRGLVVEQTFKFADYELWTEISTEPGTAAFRIDDTLTNRSDYEREFQIIYHGNFGPPLLEQGSRFVAPVKQVTPFDDYAAKDVDQWTVYRGPTKNFGEHVFNVVPFARSDGSTTVMLHNAAADRGVRIDYDAKARPHFTLWKNTDTVKEGYATGLEPGTGFPYTRSVERAHGRVPKLAGGASRSFGLEYTVLLNAADVSACGKDIARVQGDQATRVDRQPDK
jgi:hypothetical protein